MDPTGLDLTQSSSARKKIERFFLGKAFEHKNKNRTKLNRALFFVPSGGSGMHFIWKVFCGISMIFDVMFGPNAMKWHDQLRCFFFCILGRMATGDQGGSTIAR